MHRYTYFIKPEYDYGDFVDCINCIKRIYDDHHVSTWDTQNIRLAQSSLVHRDPSRSHELHESWTKPQKSKSQTAHTPCRILEILCPAS